MKIFFSVLLILFSGLSFSQQHSFEWVMEFGNPPNTTDTRTTLAAGEPGQFFMAGEFVDTAWFGDSSLESSGGTDVFIARMTGDGSFEQVWKIGGADHDYMQDIKAITDGGLLAAGYFYGSTQIGDEGLTSLGSQDVFIARFTAQGGFEWVFHAGGLMADYISAVIADDEGNIYFGGYFYGEMTFGDTTIQAQGSSDLYLARLGTGGMLDWVVTAGGSSSDQVRDISLDAQGRILLTGSFYGDITIGDTTLVTSDPVGVFISRFQNDGSPDLVFQLNGTYLTPEVYVCADPEENFYVSGNFSETITFGSKVFEAGEFNQDIFAVKYDPTGKVLWARHGHSYSSDQVIGMAVDVYGNLYLAGHYLDSLHFSNLTLPYTLCCGSREIFLVTYSPSGDMMWGDQISGPRANLHSMAIDGQGELLLSGWFTDELAFGPLILSNFTGYSNYVSGLQIDLFTSAGEVKPKDSFRLYPNPALNEVTLDLPWHSETYQYVIYDGSGRAVAQGWTGWSSTIDISALLPGLYILKINDRTGESMKTAKLLKRR